jgi:hypothetical protein
MIISGFMRAMGIGLKETLTGHILRLSGRLIIQKMIGRKL